MNVHAAVKELNAAIESKAAELGLKLVLGNLEGAGTLEFQGQPTINPITGQSVYLFAVAPR